MIRKIMSREDIEKKEHKNRVIMSVVLAVIMLFSTAGYFVMDFTGQKTKTIDYNGIKFKQNQYTTWDFIINSQAYQTIFNPEETKNISVNINTTIYTYTNQPIYFSGIPIETLSGPGVQEIVKNIGGLTLRNNYACVEENCSQDYVIKNCLNDNIIIFQISNNNQTKITQKDKCVDIIYAEGDSERASDAFLFKILGL